MQSINMGDIIILLQIEVKQKGPFTANWQPGHEVEIKNNRRGSVDQLSTPGTNFKEL